MNAAASQDTPLVGIIMGSQSDWATLEHTANMLKQLGVPFEAEVVSAHRTPDRLFEYAEQARDRGIQVIIAGAGGAAQGWQGRAGMVVRCAGPQPAHAGAA